VLERERLQSLQLGRAENGVQHADADMAEMQSAQCGKATRSQRALIVAPFQLQAQVDESSQQRQVGQPDPPA
jgi:hypothetical protein